jgi:glycosyltransferase involved in cell wall biosynthesis
MQKHRFSGNVISHKIKYFFIQYANFQLNTFGRLPKSSVLGFFSEICIYNLNIVIDNIVTKNTELPLAEYEKLFIQLKCCVIIPTFNNGTTLNQLIAKVKTYTSHIIVVNDGSTDETLETLNDQKEIVVITYAVNKGKGFAIRQGFKRAIELGYKNAITIDSDLQHDPIDFISFLELSESQPGSLIIGARKMAGVDQPKKSGFANKFSNFWFKVETGMNLPDTQSGYRLYPIKLLQKIHFFSNKYEFEVEVLVRAAWKRIPVLTVPVDVYYPPEEQRISHFRPFRDFGRISILNTILVLIAYLYVKPFSFIRYLKPKNIKTFIRENIIRTKDSNAKIVSSVMLGIFMGILPIWGWQLVAAIALAYILRLNKIIVIVAANISIPPMIPFILFFSYITGGFILGPGYDTSLNGKKIDFEFIGNNLFQYVTGSIVFAAFLAILLGLITYFLLSIFRNKDKLTNRVKNR